MSDMSRCRLNFKNVQLEINPLENGLFALQFTIETDKGYGKPKNLDIVVDTQNECVLNGKMSNMLLYVLKGRMGDNNG